MKKYLPLLILLCVAACLICLLGLKVLWYLLMVIVANVTGFLLIYLLSRSQWGVTEEDRNFLETAFSEAEKALSTGDHPIGAVLAVDGEVVAQGYSTTRSTGDQRNHAELNVLNEAMRKLQIEKDFAELKDRKVVLYTTSEPCPFCRGFLVYKKIPRVVVGERHYSFARHCGHLLSYFRLVYHMRGGINEDRQNNLYARFKQIKSKNL